MPRAESRNRARPPARVASLVVERNTAQVLILGAGAAGLSTAGALKKIGLASTVLEQDSGNWRYLGSPLRSLASAYDPSIIRSGPFTVTSHAYPATLRATSLCDTSNITPRGWA